MKNEMILAYKNNERDDFFLAPGVLVTRASDKYLRKCFGVKGLDKRLRHVKSHFKFSCVYDVQIQDEPEEFCVVSRLGGNDGENMRNIVRTSPENHLWVHGSDRKPLTIRINTDCQEAYEWAMRAIENTLRKVYLQLDAWVIDKDHAGINVQLEIRKMEQYTDYESVLPENIWYAKQQEKHALTEKNPIVRAQGGENTAKAVKEPVIPDGGAKKVDACTMFKEMMSKNLTAEEIAAQEKQEAQERKKPKRKPQPGDQASDGWRVLYTPEKPAPSFHPPFLARTTFEKLEVITHAQYVAEFEAKNPEADNNPYKTMTDEDQWRVDQLVKSCEVVQIAAANRFERLRLGMRMRDLYCAPI